MVNRLWLSELCYKNIGIVKKKKLGILWLKDRMINFLYMNMKENSEYYWEWLYRFKFKFVY